MRPWIPIAPLVLAALTASCANSPQTLPAAPQIATPIEARRPCRLHVLPAAPKASDLEIGYVERGVQLLACDAARRLAVETHEAEHELEKRRPAGRR